MNQVLKEKKKQKQNHKSQKKKVKVKKKKKKNWESWVRTRNEIIYQPVKRKARSQSAIHSVR